MASSEQTTLCCLSNVDSDEDRGIACGIEMYIKNQLKHKAQYATPPASPGEVDIYIPIVSKEFIQRGYVHVPILPRVSIIPILVDTAPSEVGPYFADALKLLNFRQKTETFQQELTERISYIIGTDIDINLLLLGKQSYPKHFTGNKILGRKLFDLQKPTNKVEKKSLCSGRRIREFRLQNVTLTDVPAIMDTGFKDNEDPIGRQLQKMENEYDGIVLVFRNPVRDTPEERESMEKMVQFVGENGLGQNGFIVITDAMDYEEEVGSFTKYLMRELEDAKRRIPYNHLGRLIKLVGEKNCLYIGNHDTDQFVYRLLTLLYSKKSSNVPKYHYQLIEQSPP